MGSQCLELPSASPTGECHPLQLWLTCSFLPVQPSSPTPPLPRLPSATPSCSQLCPARSLSPIPSAPVPSPSLHLGTQPRPLRSRWESPLFPVGEGTEVPIVLNGGQGSPLFPVGGVPIVLCMGRDPHCPPMGEVVSTRGESPLFAVGEGSPGSRCRHTVCSLRGAQSKSSPPGRSRSKPGSCSPAGPGHPPTPQSPPLPQATPAQGRGHQLPPAPMLSKKILEGKVTLPLSWPQTPSPAWPWGSLELWWGLPCLSAIQAWSHGTGGTLQHTHLGPFPLLAWP
ncbi:P3 protein [Platysternon megacephalum]|uniref:P3 protein n=1 Tax=Platysternon megacephalum TaxID=55544 RepID=A0A4D9DM24_9SAUR|nr:P3 protein [Platysternon megacephalum]